MLAFYGTRGDVEPGIAAGRELLRRGHDVYLAVPPDLIGFAESAGLAAVGYGPDTKAWLEVTRNFWARFFRNFWKLRELKKLLRESREPGTQSWAEMSTMLASVADGADLLLTGMSYQELAANVAEYQRHPIGHAAVVTDPGQRPTSFRAAGAGDPLGDDGVRVAGLARGAARSWTQQRREPGPTAGALGPLPGRIAERELLEYRGRHRRACSSRGWRLERAEWDGQRPSCSAR